jgi:carboxyl-terminal processing protease
MNRLVRPLTLFVGLSLSMVSALVVLSLAQVTGDPGSSGSDSAVVGEGGRGKDIFTQTQKFTEIFQYIRKMYFRPVDENVLISGAIEGLLQTVDRNDSFVPDTKIVLGGDDSEASVAQGLGLVLGFANLANYGASVPVVLAVLPGSPAEKAGIRPESVLWQVGDRIVVSGEVLARNLYELLDRPVDGKKVDLVLYDQEHPRLEVSLTPAPVQVPRDLETHDLPSGVLEVHFPVVVGERTADDLAKLLHDRKHDLEHGLILDLRTSCLGDAKLGYTLADLFIRDGAVLGKVMVQREEQKLVPKRGDRGEELVFRAGDGQAWLDFPLVALVDFTTAGPAEVLAGALKHAGRAKIVGAKTFGYAVKREPFVFEHGIQITLTTGLYSTGMDKVYMGEGLEPDVKVEKKEAGDLMAKAIESEVPAAEGEDASQTSATPAAGEQSKAKPPEPDLLLQSAEKEILKLKDPGKPDAAQPSKAEKSGKDVG